MKEFLIKNSSSLLCLAVLPTVVVVAVLNWYSFWATIITVAFLVLVILVLLVDTFVIEPIRDIKNKAGHRLVRKEEKVKEEK